MDPKDPVLEARNVSKVYGRTTRALEDLSVSIAREEVFGLLGANGAGKTTFVRIVATQLMPTSGSVTVLGLDVVTRAREVRGRIAVVPQEARPLMLMTPYEHVLTYLISRGASRAEARRRALGTLESLHLDSYKDTICGNLSGGLRQRVLIAMAMSTEAELLILDEPTMGLDPVARIDVWNLIRRYVEEGGRTILLTTHYMDEAEFLSDRLAIVKRGRILATGTPGEIKARTGATHAVIVKMTDGDRSGKLREQLGRHGQTMKAGSTIKVLTDQKGANELSEWSIAKHLEFSVRGVSVEDVFINEVGGSEGGGVDEDGAAGGNRALEHREEGSSVEEGGEGEEGGRRRR